MRKTLTALVAALFLILTPAAALAGSDAPTPYQVTTEGVHLPAGDTFPAGGHVNVRYFDGDGIQRTAGIHFDANNNQPGGAWIGESFIPWSAFGITEGRITWVQIHGYNQHFGEGGQKPIPVGPKPEPGTETREREDVAEREVPQCPTEEAGYGTVTTIRETFRVTEQRTSTIEWDGADWIETWTDWTETGREVTDTETVQVREMTDAEYEACGLPPTGAPLMGAAVAAGLLVLTGAGLAVARRRSTR
ncbi:MAG TPA: hypothetical protein VK046_03890 [Actinomycetaceae bacterium]|nr:hypothetical protein [Actinomycetaceae bacterium]